MPLENGGKFGLIYDAERDIAPGIQVPGSYDYVAQCYREVKYPIPVELYAHELYEVQIRFKEVSKDAFLRVFWRSTRVMNEDDISGVPEFHSTNGQPRYGGFGTAVNPEGEPVYAVPGEIRENVPKQIISADNLFSPKIKL